MDPVSALKMVTLNPAKQLRIDKWVGSIEVGKDADLVLFDGDPLAIHSVVQKTFIDGDSISTAPIDDRADHDRRSQSKLDGKARAAQEGSGRMERADSGSAPPPKCVWEDEPYSCGGDER
jgi:adenine deaminase